MNDSVNTYFSAHSSEYFGPQRDFWWNNDFLSLMAQRWNLKKVNNLLDAGCGIGHWGRSLSKFLPLDAKIFGIDKESESIKIAEKIANTNIRQSCFYQEGDILKLPYEDNKFDMVTCQTLLIHVDNVKQVMMEFIRVVKPGGLIIIVEPNNLVQTLIFNSISFHLSIDEKLDFIKFHLICENGKTLLKEGNSSIGDMIPIYLNDLNIENIEVFLSDKASFLLPPYNSEEQKINLQQLKEWESSNFGILNKKQYERHFNAGIEAIKLHDGFQFYWEKIQKMYARILDDISNNRFSCSGSSLMYLVSGTKKNVF